MDVMKILGNLGFDWPVALANFLNFLIIFFLLKKFAFGPIKKVIAERQARIAEGLENAQKADTALMMADEKKKEITADARLEANKILAEAKRQAITIVTKAKEEAAVEAEGVMRAAREKMLLERVEMERQVREGVVGIMARGIETILREDTDTVAYERRIRHILAEKP